MIGATPARSRVLFGAAVTGLAISIRMRVIQMIKEPVESPEGGCRLMEYPLVLYE
jgi:hypothetical protein